MFRSDRDALAGKVDDLRAENERLRAQNDAMRADLLLRRAAAPAPAVADIYRSDLSHLSSGERAALSAHRLEAFPMWALVLLHVLTLGVFSFVRLNLMHDRLPRAQHNDPSAAKGIGFSFLPYFHMYWLVWNPLRLADRVNLQYRLRGLRGAVPRWLTILAGVLTVVPYVGFIVAPITWLVLAIVFQRAVNRLVAISDGTAPREALEEAGEADVTGVPGVRIPAVRDLPGPDEAAAEAAAEDEAAAAPVTGPMQARR